MCVLLDDVCVLLDDVCVLLYIQTLVACVCYSIIIGDLGNDLMKGLGVTGIHPRHQDTCLFYTEHSLLYTLHTLVYRIHTLVYSIHTLDGADIGLVDGLDIALICADSHRGLLILYALSLIGAC